jgi:hypothetical protein
MSPNVAFNLNITTVSLDGDSNRNTATMYSNVAS